MVSFTDDDLKRLKAKEHFGHDADCTVSLPSREFKALLARLEAAEKALDSYISDDSPCKRKVCAQCEWNKAWLKAAGK